MYVSISYGRTIPAGIAQLVYTYTPGRTHIQHVYNDYIPYELFSGVKSYTESFTYNQSCSFLINAIPQETTSNMQQCNATNRIDK